MRDERADRRTIIGAGALLAGIGAAPAAIAGTRPAGGAGAGAAAARYQPAFEPQDAWMDDPAKRHRMVFDTTSASAAQSALFFADNFYTANKTGYGIAPQAVGVVIVLRHMSTPFGYNDAIWKKYGEAAAEQLMLKGAEAIKATKGKKDADKAIAAVKGFAWTSPRGPVSIDPKTREIVQNVYIRRVETIDGKLGNKPIETFKAVVEPWHVSHPQIAAK